MAYKNKEDYKRYKIENRDKLLERRREVYRLKNLNLSKVKVIITDEEKIIKKQLKDKRYREKYPDKIKLKKQEYYQKNKDKINSNYLIKLKSSPQMKISHSIRTRMYQALKGKIKPNSSIKSLGCSIEYFIEFIEGKFIEDMTWDNHGSYWHLDHIKPLCLFNLENELEFSEACHFSNYQPLKCLENLIKNKFYLEIS